MRFFLSLIFGFFLANCTPKEPLYNTQSYVFGTLVDISIYGETEVKSQAVSNEIFKQFQELHRRLHAWKPSEISTLNSAFAQGKSADIAPDVATILENAAKLSAQSNGAFNPAIGGLINAWGFQNDEFKPIKVDKEKIKGLVNANPQMSDLVIEKGKAHSKNLNLKLDLGGYAKGYALDRALIYLQEQGVKNALVNIGGNLIALGRHGEKPWHIGIQHPRQPNAIASLDLPSGWAIGTSGDYQRYFELDGKRYCHIIDPATGNPVQNTNLVTVLIPPQANAGVLSDVASKPIFIAQTDARLDAAKKMGIENFLVIESADKILVSQSMAKRLYWLDKNAAEHATIIRP
jgi:FAD:protein FMN transferase